MTQWINVNDMLPAKPGTYLALEFTGIAKSRRWQNGRWLGVNTVSDVTEHVRYWTVLPVMPVEFTADEEDYTEVLFEIENQL